MKWALVDSNSICQNIISYDVGSNYQPPEGVDLIEVNDWIDIGEDINTPAPPPSEPSLEERRKGAMDALLAKRNGEMQKNIEVDEVEYFADQESQNLINQALSSQERGIEGIFPANWLLPTGSIKQVTYDDLKAVNAAVAQRVATNYGNYFTLVQQIMVSENPEQIDINNGWSN